MRKKSQKSKMPNKNRFPNQSRQVYQDTEKNVAGRAVGGGESGAVEQENRRGQGMRVARRAHFVCRDMEKVCGCINARI
jgi:hypothetical protein